MVRRKTRRQRGSGNCQDAMAYARCKAGSGVWFKKFSSLIRPVLITYIIDNPKGDMCMTNSGTLLKQFVRDEKAKRSMWSGIVWEAAEDKQANLQIRWMMDTIRTDNEFRSACAKRDKQQMTLIMDEYLQRFKDHACDAFNEDYYYGTSCNRKSSPYDALSNSACQDLGYRVACTDPRVLHQQLNILRGGRRRSTLRSTLA